ncbi:hypothetical protein Nmel_013084, partial [Mimus melanotis]
MRIGIIDRPVDILHPEIWDKCTEALAQETIFSGSGKNLKSWGKVIQALQKALQEQETWKAAQNCLLATPPLGVGATTQMESSSIECKASPEQETPPQPLNPDPPIEKKEQAQLFWGRLAEEARNAAAKVESERTRESPPPYIPQNGAEPQGDGRGADAVGGNSESPLDDVDTREQERGERPRGGAKANQGACLKTYP